MKIEDIPSDELITMEDTMHRSFNACGCNPMCHCCEKMIPVEGRFKLATIKKANKIWRIIDIKLKERERNGEIITDEILWNEHGIEIRFNYSQYHVWQIKPHKHISISEKRSVSYKEYLSGNFKSFDEDKMVYCESDVDEWEKIKNNFRDSSHEVMLCDMCTPELYTENESKKFRDLIEEESKPKRKGGCFRVNGKIVI